MLQITANDHRLFLSQKSLMISGPTVNDIITWDELVEMLADINQPPPLSRGYLVELLAASPGIRIAAN